MELLLFDGSFILPKMYFNFWPNSFFIDWFNVWSKK